jgi:hypothetical protein
LYPGGELGDEHTLLHSSLRVEHTLLFRRMEGRAVESPPKGASFTPMGQSSPSGSTSTLGVKVRPWGRDQTASHDRLCPFVDGLSKTLDVSPVNFLSLLAKKKSAKTTNMCHSCHMCGQVGPIESLPLFPLSLKERDKCLPSLKCPLSTYQCPCNKAFCLLFMFYFGLLPASQKITVYCMRLI